MTSTLLYDQGPVASRPAAGVRGRIYNPTDESGVLYKDEGAGWVRIPPYAFNGDISTAVSHSTFSVGTETGAPYGVHFNPDGTQFFVADASTNFIYRYDLTTAWDLATATGLAQTLDTSAEGNSRDVWLSRDGTKLFAAHTGDMTIARYDLSTAWDFTTATYIHSFSVSGWITASLEGLCLAHDGTKLFVSEYGLSDFAHGYSLSTAWDLTTATFASSFDLGPIVGSDNPQAIELSPQGHKLYTVARDYIYELDLATPWDVSTASLLRSFRYPYEAAHRGVRFTEDGNKMVTVGTQQDVVRLWLLS